MPAVDRFPLDERRRAPRGWLGASRGALLIALLVMGAVQVATSTAVSAQTVPAPVVGQSTPSTVVPAGEIAQQPETVASEAEPVAAAKPPKRFLTEDRKIFIVVFGLVFVALALSLLTFRYWRQTKPIRPVEPHPAPKHAAGANARARTSDVAAGPDTVAMPLVPASTGFPAKAAPVPTAPVPSFPKVDVAALPKLPLAGFPELAIATDEEPETEDRSSRRSVAGADHRTADADWEPRGTGEHARVEVSNGSRPSRPGRGARKAALDRSS